MNDSGLYECYVGYGNPEDTKKPVSSINLTVEEPGPAGGQGGDGTEGDGDKNASVGLIVGVSFAVLVLGVVAAFVGSMIFRRRRDQQNQNYEATNQDESHMNDLLLVPSSYWPVYHSHVLWTDGSQHCEMESAISRS